MIAKKSLDQLNRDGVDDYKKKKKLPLHFILDNVRSGHNVGSIFRTSDAFAIEKICLGGFTPHPPHKQIYKSALGAQNTVAWEYKPTLKAYLEGLKKKNTVIVGIEQTHQSISLLDMQWELGTAYALIFGNEIEGINDELLNCCDKCIEIPQFGTKHSFNISVSTGIILWDYFYKLHMH